MGLGMCAAVFRISVLSTIFCFVTCTPGDEVRFHYIADPKENVHDDHRGNITVIPKTKLTLICSTLIINRKTVHWQATSYPDNVKQEEGRNSTAVYSELRIADASPDNTAMYTCFDRGRGSSYKINIKVEALCGPPPAVTHSRIVAPSDTSKFEIDSVVEYSCISGYEVEGFTLAKCSLYRGTAQWFGPNHRCNSGCKTEALLGFRGLILSCQSSLDEGEWLQPVCSEGFEFSNKNDTRIYCLNGNWTGNLPPCSPAKRNPEIELPTPSTEAVIVPTSVHTSLEEVTELHNDTLKNVEDDDEKGPVVDEIVSSENKTVGNGEAELTTVTTVNPPCSCKYIVKDNNLIAHVGSKVFQFNDDVYKGSVVGFHCKEPGFHHFRGRTSVTCPEDCSWYSTLFPSCVMPHKDDVIIRILAEPANNIHVGPGGNITVIPGTKLLFRCSIPYKYGAELNWFRADGSRTGIQQPKINPRTQVLSTYYVLWDVSYRDSGTYTCINHERLTRTVSIDVKVVQCPEINATQVDISYEQNRTFGSRATFHCFTPYKRNGPSYVTCEASGLWSEPPSSCYLPTCTIVSVRDVIPKGVVPVVDDSALQSVTFGYRLQLICDPVGSTSMVLKGQTTAICGNDEKWELGSEIRCVEGCPSLQKKNGSALLISPERDFYGFGDLILFSCPEGKDLTKDVEQILCLSTGWTPNTIPDCK